MRDCGDKSYFQNRCSRDPGFYPLPDSEAQRQGRTGISGKSGRTFDGTVLDRAVYL